MEPGLNAAPPPALEKLVWHLLPPMVREEVAGDLWERFRSPPRYLADAYIKAERAVRDRKTMRAK